MGIDKLIDILKQLPPAFLNDVLLTLLRDKCIDFRKVSELYVKSLESDNSDLENQLTEAEACLFDGLMHTRKSKLGQENIQRSLYLINQLNKHYPQKLNEKYHYDETVGKSLSCYEARKKQKVW